MKEESIPKEDYNKKSAQGKDFAGKKARVAKAFPKNSSFISCIRMIASNGRNRPDNGPTSFSQTVPSPFQPPNLPWNLRTSPAIAFVAISH